MATPAGGLLYEYEGRESSDENARLPPIIQLLALSLGTENRDSST
jgi:hypothetical protein